MTVEETDSVGVTLECVEFVRVGEKEAIEAEGLVVPHALTVDETVTALPLAVCDAVGDTVELTISENEALIDFIAVDEADMDAWLVGLVDSEDLPDAEANPLVVPDTLALRDERADAVIRADWLELAEALGLPDALSHALTVKTAEGVELMVGVGVAVATTVEVATAERVANERVVSFDGELLAEGLPENTGVSEDTAE